MLRLAVLGTSASPVIRLRCSWFPLMQPFSRHQGGVGVFTRAASRKVARPLVPSSPPMSSSSMSSMMPDGAGWSTAWM
mgnify:CR=1 FL=1